MGNKYMKWNLATLIAIIPLCFLGYWFAVNNEALFYLFEWLLVFLLVISVIISILGITTAKGTERWMSTSILSFLVQLIAFSLFLGPLTQFYPFIYVFYFISLVALISQILVCAKVENSKWLPIVFIIVGVLFVLFVGIIQSLWGTVA
ncbi:hypothetical protein [Aquibacillus kalidii]|uniref:hypothetical protein n=1 Tax=Aquibacillus kalidii TaxID=2762597 RepID=UPI0016448EF1|nr:hypothetical protein [Aquibacillus kalidii]